ncbi:AbrB/MazE/SpoVT family DNA-binding domain-containing protein [Francisella tularensis subsp. novicida]|uniref:AbrB/MazE/SpoVT family DNA-binding domain-containing protein n=1 Tax=Francisella tularensis TaxID=263 RepID=UPI0005010FC6|nr:AbrB/MazE/SpoVT family DNA-binding domain-containing protein [Francisella tularensis]AJJ48323.1 transcriptional regulator, AbrB family domain protein [Francisella tularensis subsp. novicida]KFJ70804.1 transcriptional regulator, AbrB family domain protein [Francisella tularensis subsp. novicida]MBK2345291.1 AbrB/MazE/SpoVT family DNA-binding domain-containing protein [Francisella tularensis subsp. novicida]MBK2350641.1 AbrB/MazE/SpoVT family DNA-binding domain-containing protein [Francisella 
MTTLTIRRTGNANTVSIPKKILKILNLHVGDELDIDVKNNEIVLKPHTSELTLESLLEQSDKNSFKIIKEDEEWINTKSKGLEI